MKVLITAGSTIVPIDKVRVISNIFKGRTGSAIAEYFAAQGAEVTLITSNPKLVSGDGKNMTVVPYDTFDSLKEKMEAALSPGNGFDAIVHSAAISDYKTAGVYVNDGEAGLVSIDNASKISSSHEELFLKLVPTEKLVDLIRSEWKFRGVLVKFKLQVGISDEELLEIAQKSRADSDADLIVANCLEWAAYYAYIVNRGGQATKISRRQLPEELYHRVLARCPEFVRNRGEEQ